MRMSILDRFVEMNRLSYMIRLELELSSTYDF